MNTKLSNAAWLRTGALAMAGLLVFAACKKDETEETNPATTAAPEPQPTEEPSASAEPTAAAGPQITPRIKAEVDGKDATAGHTMTLVATGAKGSFSAPTDWKKSVAAAFTVAKAADSKSAIAVGKHADGDDTAAQANAAATALGYAECQWGSSETATIGSDKLVGDVADGVCKEGATVVRVAYATIAGPNNEIIAVGGWHDGTDATALFNTFRTAKKGASGGDSTGIAACCAALRQNAASAPLQQKGAYLAAAGACQAAISNPQGRAALAQVRAMLAGANVPGSCR